MDLDKDIEFQSLGPSPFHADFFVRFDGSDDLLRVDVDQLRGYDDVFISGPKTLSKAQQQDFVGECQRLVATELGVFYEATQTSYRLGVQWNGIRKNFDRLTESRRGFWQKIRNHLRWPPWLRTGKVSLSLATFKLKLNEEIYRITRELSRNSADGLEELQIYTQSKIDDLRAFPTDDYAKVLDILIKRKTARAANIVVLLAALIGFVGGILGSVFQAKLSDAVPTNNQSPPSKQQIDPGQ